MLIQAGGPVEPRALPGEAASTNWGSHEKAAHEVRAWVRLTYDCNDRCIFCLDSETHDGQIRSREAVLAEIVGGRRRGATRLILSGGEPTIHPEYIEFIRAGHRAGYRRIQTVTNGRRFAYPEFLRKCLDAGLGEITFSIHGPNARVHDALVGVKGAYQQEIAGLRWAIADGRPIVNVDICVNQANVKHLRRMLDGLMELGVREFDLLQVIPFGRAYTEGKDTLFYDLADEVESLRAAFEVSRLPGVHLWLNRFPIQHLEGYEDLAQDPHKFIDEVRGRQEEFRRLFETGQPLDCRQPERCRHCYLEPLCDRIAAHRSDLVAASFERVRIDTGWEDQEHRPAASSDPASVKWIAMQEAAGKGRPRLDIEPLESSGARAGATTLLVVAPDVASAASASAGRFPDLHRVALELGTLTGLGEALDAEGCLDGRKLVQIVVKEASQTEAALALPGDFEVVIALTQSTWPWILAQQTRHRGRLAARLPNWDRVSLARAEGLDLRLLAGALDESLPVEGVPECLLGRPPRPVPATLDTTRHGPDARLEVFRTTRRFIEDGYFAKSLRCRGCARNTTCDGLHVNLIAAQGLGILRPIPG
jgi:MoaA/NifB/PqqE/SkfB family radical SAM enzyme